MQSVPHGEAQSPEGLVFDVFDALSCQQRDAHAPIGLVSTGALRLAALARARALSRGEIGF